MIRTGVGLIVVLVFAGLAGCISQPDIPSKATGQGLVDTFRFSNQDNNMNIYEHMFVREILDTNGEVIWTAAQHPIPIPKYASGREQVMRTLLPAGTYTFRVGCHLGSNQIKQASDYVQGGTNKFWRLKINLGAGEYVSLYAYLGSKLRLTGARMNGHTYSVPSYDPLCRIKSYTEYAK